MSERVEARRAVLAENREGMILPVTVEFRDEGDGLGPDHFTMVGHAATFNTLSEDLGGFREIIKPGAFREATKSSLVHLLWNHDSSKPLASTDSGTLQVKEDEDGLRIWARIPKALSYAQDIRTLFSAGITRSMSFAFSMPKDGTGEEWTRMADGMNLRTLTRVDAIYDVSPVTRPAYDKPAFSMRSILDARATRLDAQADPAVTTDSDAQADPAVGSADAQDDLAVRDLERATRLASMRAQVALALNPER